MCAGRRITAILFMFLALPLFPADTENILAKIRTEMGKVKTLTADFVQEKKITSIRHTLTIHGELALDKSGRMAWRVNKPIQYVCIISGNKLMQWDADSDSVLTLDTSKNPSLKILASSMTSYFSGDFDMMAEQFRIVAENAHKLHLTPLKGNMAGEFISSLEFETSPDYSHIVRVLITEKNGDTTAIRFINTQLNREIPESIWRAGAK